MPLSGAAMISENTAAASFSRFAGSLSAASSGVSAIVVATVVAIINFTVHLPSAMTLSVQPRVGCRCAPRHVANRPDRVGSQNLAPVSSA